MPLQGRELEMEISGLPKVHIFGDTDSEVKPRFVEHQNILMNGEPDVPNPIYVFDLDGTIADINHRLHFIQKPKWKDRDYDKQC